MAKCVRCGRGGMGLMHPALKLKDKSWICTKCYKDLGFDPKDDMTLSRLLYTYDDIKDGRQAMYEKRNRERVKQAVLNSVSVTMTYGERDRIATETELELNERILEIVEDHDLPATMLRCARFADDYLSIVVDLDDVGSHADLVRYKFTTRTAWVRLYPEYEKIPIKSVDDIDSYVPEIVESFERLLKDCGIE